MAAFIEHVQNPSNIRINSSDVPTVEWNLIYLSLNSNRTHLDGLYFLQQWVILSETKTDNSLSQIISNCSQLAYCQHKDYYPEYDEKTGAMKAFWVSIYKFGFFVGMMCKKYAAAADMWFDGNEDWINHFDELIYGEFIPKIPKEDRAFKVGRMHNIEGRENGQRQQSDNSGYVEYIALVHVPFGSPAETAIKKLTKDRFLQPTKSPSGIPLKKEAFIVPEELTTNEKNTVYSGGVKYEECIESNSLISRVVHTIRDCFDNSYSDFVVELNKRGTEVFDEKVDESCIWQYNERLSPKENAILAKEFKQKALPWQNFLKRNIHEAE